MKTKLTSQVIAFAFALDNVKTKSQISMRITRHQLIHLADTFTEFAGGEDYIKSQADQDTPEINFLNFLEQARVVSSNSKTYSSAKIESLLMKAAKEFSDWVSVVQDCPTNSNGQFLGHSTDDCVRSILFHRQAY